MFFDADEEVDLMDFEPSQEAGSFHGSQDFSLPGSAKSVLSQEVFSLGTPKKTKTTFDDDYFPSNLIYIYQN